MLLDHHLLRLLNFIIYIGSYFADIFVRWSVTLSSLFTFTREPLRWVGTGSTTSTVDAIAKLPRHLACLILEKNISYKDIANLILWSAEIGISYISIYDPNGTIKRNCKILENLIHSKDLEKTIKPVYFQTEFPVETQTEDFIFGRSSGVRVALLSSADGSLDLVQVTKHMLHQINSYQWQLTDVIPSQVDKIIQERHGFPDPDLILRFGNVSSLLGFLPWQVRLSEILSIPSHHGLNYRSYEKALSTFSNLQQRFGK